MNWKQKIKTLLRANAYYLAFGLCIAAVAVSGWLFVRSLSGADETPAQNDAVQAAVLPTLPWTKPTEKPAPSVPAKPSRPAKTEPAETEPSEPVSAQDRADAQPGAVLCRPVEGTVLQRYSMDKLSYNATTRDWRTHDGTDLAAPEGSEVRAVAEGTVLAVFADDLLGRTVTVEHAGGWVTHYANLAEEVPVKAGDRVTAGQTLGTVGKTALGEIASPPHLHFAVYKNNVSQDPEAYLASVKND